MLLHQPRFVSPRPVCRLVCAICLPFVWQSDIEHTHRETRTLSLAPSLPLSISVSLYVYVPLSPIFSQWVFVSHAQMRMLARTLSHTLSLSQTRSHRDALAHACMHARTYTCASARMQAGTRAIARRGTGEWGKWRGPNLCLKKGEAKGEARVQAGSIGFVRATRREEGILAQHAAASLRCPSPLHMCVSAY